MEDDMKFRHTLPVQIRFSDVDQYGHMNNSSYFSLYDLAKTRICVMCSEIKTGNT